MKFLNLALFLGSSSAFMPHVHYTTSHKTQLYMGLFDDLKLIFSDEGKKNKAEYEEQQKIEQEEAQRMVMERRRNPEKMQRYEEEVKSRRLQLESDTRAWDFQREASGADFQREASGADPLDKWTELRAAGVIKAGDDIERDPTSSRLGSEGLQEIRTDDKLPYVEKGYVDEDADVMGNLKKMFGKKK